MKIKFSTSGAAFKSEYEDKATNDLCTRGEVARILKKITVEIENGEDHGSIMDINGNKIGSWEI